jgi:3-oxoacyl-[acyl-carrier-protein] synthase-1
MTPRIVITGMGIISSIGNNNDEVLESLKNNKPGIESVPEWIELGFRSTVAGTIKGLNEQNMRQKIGLKSRFMDLSALYALLAAEEALQTSGLKQQDIANDRVGCIVGSGISSTDPIVRSGLKINSGTGMVTPYDITRCMSNSCSANLVNYYGIKGRSYSLSSACATSLHNIGHGAEIIAAGGCDIVLAGGAEEVTAALTLMFDGMRTVLSKAFNDTPETASRPYDERRDGFVISGGSGIVILEELEHAKKRNAPIFAEIIGFGANSDGHDIIQPDPTGNGGRRCMVEALKMAGLAPDEIDYINTHATSTPEGDTVEALAIKNAFGEYKVPVSSTKSITGHGIGAAGAQELVYCLLMMKHNFISASMNIEKTDPACDHLNIITRNRECNLDKVMTISLGFGGTNGSIVIKKI